MKQCIFTELAPRQIQSISRYDIQCISCPFGETFNGEGMQYLIEEVLP